MSSTWQSVCKTLQNDFKLKFGMKTQKMGVLYGEFDFAGDDNDKHKYFLIEQNIPVRRDWERLAFTLQASGVIFDPNPITYQSKIIKQSIPDDIESFTYRNIF